MNAMTPIKTVGTLVIRLKPNQDLATALEKACAENEVSRALVRSGVGSLTDCVLEYGEGKRIEAAGPGVEILTLIGEVSPGPDGTPTAILSGSIADLEGKVFGGRFVKDANPVCITLELVLDVIE